MAKPQSKERLGTVILLIAAWALIMTVVFTTKCGHQSSTPPPSDLPADSVTALTDTVLPDSIKEQAGKPQSKKKKGKGKEKKPVVDRTRDILGDTVRSK